MKGDIRCIEGRLFRHDPQWDDPDLETDVGQCPECEGDGCDKWCAECGCEETDHRGILVCECPATLKSTGAA